MNHQRAEVFALIWTQDVAARLNSHPPPTTAFSCEVLTRQLRGQDPNVDPIEVFRRGRIRPGRCIEFRWDLDGRGRHHRAGWRIRR